VTDIDTLEERLTAVERALTDGESDFETLAEAGEVASRLETVERRLDDLEEQVSELDAATQALRGYVGNVRSVNRDVERRAETALAKVEEIESQYVAPDGQSEPAATGGQSESTETPNFGEQDRTEHEHRCTACGQVTDETTTRQRDEPTPSEWAREVGADRGPSGETAPRADGGPSQERPATGQTARGRNDGPRREDSDADGSLLDGLRDAL